MAIIMETGYGLQASFDRTPEEVDAAVREALASEGFGILSEIDVQTTLKNKIDVDPGTYTILGACNPHLANKAIGSEKDIGLLLPCNVLIREGEGGTTVLAIIDPASMMDVAESPALEEVAAEARQKLESALEKTTAALS